MKKTTKLIAMLTVISLLTVLAGAALADDKIYTSSVFKIPLDRVERPEEINVVEPEAEPEVTEEPVVEPEPEPVPEQPAGEAQPAKPVERQVKIFSSRKDVVIENEIIELSSELIGFDDVVVHYQWQVDRGDGAGWVDVEGATRPKHSFVARRDTILYNWRLIVSVDE